MACNKPLTGYRGAHGTIVFNIYKSLLRVPIDIPCGQCMGCRVQKQQTWATRLMQEKRLHAASAFLTLTYNDDALPAGNTLVKADLQKFMKRLRKRRPQGLRFFACGEYGAQLERPHYHILLLNTSFPDMKKWKANGNNTLHVSAELSHLWPNGYHSIGDVNNQTVNYVSGYVIKKKMGPERNAHYGNREAEFIVMSNRPGIGKLWYDKYGIRSYEQGTAIYDYREVSIPKYYDKHHEKIDPQQVETLRKEARRKAKLERKADNTPERRAVKEHILHAKAELFKRDNIR